MQTDIARQYYYRIKSYAGLDDDYNKLAATMNSNILGEEELENIPSESLLESVTEGTLDPTYPEDPTSSVWGLKQHTEHLAIYSSISKV